MSYNYESLPFNHTVNAPGKPQAGQTPEQWAEAVTESTSVGVEKFGREFVRYFNVFASIVNVNEWAAGEYDLYQTTLERVKNETELEVFVKNQQIARGLANAMSYLGDAAAVEDDRDFLTHSMAGVIFVLMDIAAQFNLPVADKIIELSDPQT